jgi:hypothetical protein
MSDREDLDELISREAVLSIGSAREIVGMITARGWIGPSNVAEFVEANQDLAEENEMWMTLALNRKTEIENLERWKAEMLPVMAGMQELGKALGLTLGTQITGPQALEAVTELRDELESWKAEALSCRAWGGH